MGMFQDGFYCSIYHSNLGVYYECVVCYLLLLCIGVLLENGLLHMDGLFYTARTHLFYTALFLRAYIYLV